MTYPQGFDISSNQHPNGARIDFTAARAGWSFVIVKATEGATYQNPYFAADTRDAHAAGFLVDAYHWVSPSSAAADQVANVLRVLKAAGFAGRVWLDYEQSGDVHPTLDAVRAGLRDAHLTTGTYVYPEFWKQHGDRSCAQCAADPLWFAWDFPEEPTADAVAGRGFTIAPWSNVTVWQYAGTSVAIPGVPGLNDANRLLAPLPDLATESAQPTGQEADVFELIRNTATGEIYVWSAGGAWWHVPDANWENVALSLGPTHLCAGQAEVNQVQFDLLKAIAASARGQAS